MPTQSEPWTPADASAKHVPNWNILQGDCLTDPQLCRTFLTHASPPAERLRHANCSPQELSDRAALHWAASMAIMPEVCRRWDEGRREVESLKKTLAQRVAETARVSELEQAAKTLEWQMKDKDAAHAKARAEFEAACSRTNSELAARTQAVRATKAQLEEVLARRDKEKAEFEEVLVRRDKEKAEFEEERKQWSERITRLEGERKWLIGEGIPRAVEVARGSDEFLQGIVGLNRAAEAAGRHVGVAEGYRAAKDGKSLESLRSYNPSARAALLARQDVFDRMELPLIQSLAGMADCADLDELKSMLTFEDE